MTSLFLPLFFATIVSSIHGRISFDKFTSEVLIDYAKVEGVVEEQANGNNVLNVNLDITKDLDFKPMISTELFKKAMDKNVYSSVLLVPKVSYCGASGNRNPLVDIILDQIKKFSNVPTECPIKAGKYYIKNLVIPDAVFPPFVFSGGSYKEVIKFYDDADKPKLLGIVTVYLLYEP